MNRGESRIAALRAALDPDEALALLKGAVATPSVTGNERDFAHWLQRELAALGAKDVTVEDFAAGRPNVWGRMDGDGDGPRVLLIGHTDTVHVRGWAERWAGTERADPFGAAVIEGELWGRGAGDLKAGLCAALLAVRLLRRSGLSLPRVLFGFVGDEESGEPGSGTSAGMKAFARAMETGAAPRPDLAVYVEPTRLDIYVAQMGFLICDITITGKSAYFGVPELGIDALKAGHAALSALFAHSRELEKTAPHALVGRPFLLVTAMNAGGYIAVPGECRLSLILKLIPGQSLDEAGQALEAAVRAAPFDPGVRVAFAYPAGRDHRLGGEPAEVSAATPFVAALREAVRSVRPDRGAVEGAPFWSEASFLTNRLGIPAVYFAPGDIRNCHTLEERVEVQDYFDGIVALAAFLATLGEDAAQRASAS